MILLLLLLFSCKEQGPSATGTKKDYSDRYHPIYDTDKKPAPKDCPDEMKNAGMGKEIPSVMIGKAEWMSANLNVDTFRNGDPIKEIRSNEEWEIAGTKGIPAWSYYNNNPCNSKYGKLYNFHAVEDERGLAPEGWHIPFDEEWNHLEQAIGGDIAKKMKCETGWYDNGSGTNESGFCAQPAGIRYYDGSFLDFGTYGFFWSGSSSVVAHGWLRFLRSDYNDRMFRTKGGKPAGMSVRCVRDYDNPPPYE